MSNIEQINSHFDPYTPIVEVSKSIKLRNTSGVNPRSLRGPHFVQLALHDIQLLPEDGRRDYADPGECESEQADSARPSRHHPFIDWMLGCVFFGATAAAVVAAFKSAEYADDYGSRFWWLPFVSLLTLAFWLANHAIGVFMATSNAGL